MIAPSGFETVGQIISARTGWLRTISSNAETSSPVRGWAGISSARRPRLSIDCSTPKYAGDSTAITSPGRATARSASERPSVAPIVVHSSSSDSATPVSTARRAIWRRSVRRPGAPS